MQKGGFPKSNVSQTELPKESISLKAVFIFLGFIFILLASMLVYLRFSSWSPFYDYYAKKTPANLSFSDLFNKTKSSKPGVKAIDMKITETDLAEALGIGKSDFPLKKATLVIKPEGIILSGKTSTAFWGIPVEVTSVPIVRNGKLFIQIKGIKAGGVVAPPKIADSLSPKINTLFYQAFSAFDNLKVTEARTSVGFVMLEVEE